ncbi:zinc finger domain-containing protein [Mucilaginibacter antarcticus]|uniref:LSD1 subclass zinc finger protein n=2 Tax=Mucilaginibacter antarcticus TaxID=1855725 RepID=A0ABW5XT86_9SPHI
MSEVVDPSAVNQSLSCGGCGALLHFVPGTRNLQCQYCGESNVIESKANDDLVVSLDYEKFVAGIDTSKQSDSLKAVSCPGCGSQTMLEVFVTSDKCPFCTSPLVLDLQGGKAYVQPHYVLPFEVTQQQGVDFFKKWLAGLWWTPNDLAKIASNSSVALKGVYLPHWTYDTDTTTIYTGQRGDYYYTTETYTETVNGRSETRTRQVRHTRWSSASGTVNCDFRDLVVPASKSLPDKTLYNLTPWKFSSLVKFDERYMSGFRSETYQIDPQQGLQLAKQQTIDEIHSAIRSDIGGDEQQIDDTNTDYENNAIKYLMLPVWVSAYKYNAKIYQFTVNASTGEVIGERPLSAWKITLAVLFGLIVLAIAFLYLQNH